MLFALVLGIETFTVCWLVHVIVWRLFKPKTYLVWLPSIFFLLPACIWLYSGARSTIGIDAAVTQPYIAGMSLHFFLSCCYICGFAGVAEYSPSAEILKVIKRHMPGGVSTASLQVQAFTEYALTGKRIDHLLGSKLIRREGELLVPTAYGFFLFSLCKFYRLIVGVKVKGEG